MPRKKQKTEISAAEKHAFNKAVIQWEAPLYRAHEKSLEWYIGAGIILSVLVIYAIATDAWTFAVALIAYAYVYLQTHRNKPTKEKIIISEIGIKEGKNMYPYSSIKAFWIVYHPPLTKQLHIVLDRKVLPEVTIQLNDQDPAELRNFLCGQVPEWEGKTETFVDALCRTLKL